MVATLKEEYELRKASKAEKSTPAFATKDYVTIGISVLALATTLFFNVFLKSDDIRGAFRGTPPVFALSGDGLTVRQADGSLVVSNTGNRAATVMGINLFLTGLDNAKIPDHPCHLPGGYYHTYISVTPIVLKAGEAAVVPLKLESGTRIPFPSMKVDANAIQVLGCIGVQVLTPSTIIDSEPSPLMMTEARRNDTSGISYTRLDKDSTFTIYRSWSLFR